MNKGRRLILRLKGRRGIASVVVALSIVMLIGFIALAVDIGYVMVVKNEAQNIADAASLAAARKIGNEYSLLNYQQQQGYVCNPATILPIARDVATKNKAGGKNINLNDADIIIGTWDAKNKILTPTLNQPDAVRVTARRDDAANGPIATFFARILGINTFNVSADATAALTGLSGIEPDNLIPVGISEYWFTSNDCRDDIKFYPTNDPIGCAGWNTFNNWPASESKLRKDILEAWLSNPNDPPVPGAKSGDEFVFTGGTLGDQTFTAFENLFNYMKTRDGDGDGTAWTVSVVVYSATDCKNPSGNIKIVGFATAKITQVIGPPTKIIMAKVECNYVKSGRGGGRDFWLKGDIPGLVE